MVDVEEIVSTEETCSGCSKKFMTGPNTIHCLRCDRWYCTETECWIEWNDENMAGNCCKKGINGEYIAYDCDECLYGNAKF